MARQQVHIQLRDGLNRGHGHLARIRLRDAADGNADAEQTLRVNLIGLNKVLDGLRQEGGVRIVVGDGPGDTLAADQLRADVDARQMDPPVPEVDADGAANIVGHANRPRLAAPGRVKCTLEFQQVGLLQLLQILPHGRQAEGEGLRNVLFCDRMAGRIDIPKDAIAVLTAQFSGIKSCHSSYHHTQTFRKVIEFPPYCNTDWRKSKRKF